MTQRTFERLVQMDAAEAAWRARVVARTAWDRARSSLREPRWDRRTLSGVLDARPSLDDVRDALDRRRFGQAHRRLAAHLLRRPSRFVLSPAHRGELVTRLTAAIPDAAEDARRRGDRLLAGEHDLLGYTGLRFKNWHDDPVHGRGAPMAFWADVPYLDPEVGDHKVIWELNRHQHWLALGRAWWLTGVPTYRERFLHELDSWMAENPPLVGINWASMLELAFRSISWTWALHFFLNQAEADERPWLVDLLLGIDRQLTHIEQNLSHYFSPNTHLIGEALALYVTGCALPELAGSSRRQAIGRRVLVAELSNQVASDGGHCERSTHYHRYTLDFCLLALAVARIVGDPIVAVFESAARRLASAARMLADDDGRLPHIGDDDGGMLLPIAGRSADDISDSLAIAGALVGPRDLQIGPAPEEALWLLAHPALSQRLPAQSAEPRLRSLPSSCLPQTGYYVSRSGYGAHLVIDGGPHGFRNGGHAHADALSLTLSLRGAPLLIDPGTGAYTIDCALRDRFRSTSAHNTVVVDDRSQSIPSGPFHWASTADATVHRWRTQDIFDYFDGSHRGYAPLEHRRRVLALHGDMIVVADLVTGGGAHTADVNWHVDPRWQVELLGRTATLRSGSTEVALVVPHGTLSTSNGDDEAGIGWHSPVYGRVEPTTTITLRQAGRTPMWLVSVFDLNRLDPIMDVEWLPLWAEAGVLEQSAAVKIARASTTACVAWTEPGPGRGQALWRAGEFETDARMMCCRVSRSGEMTAVELVDGSVVRGGSGRRGFKVALGRRMPAVHIDGTSLRTFTPCAASPVS